LRILITNNRLAQPSGSELYVRDLAVALLRRGHSPVVYSPHLGDLARELRQATVPVIDRLEALKAAPDLIHGQHHVEAMMALLHFPQTPAVFVCHGWLPWAETPPRFPRILRYVAVDHTCRDRLVCEGGIPEDRVRVILNFVDLGRFRARGPLPARPQRALVFSNNAREDNYYRVIESACRRAGMAVDVVGMGVNNVSQQPERILAQYDVVFAKARCALEALATGNAVVLCDQAGAGPMVTTGELARLRRLNFGIRTLQEPIRPEIIAREINRYDPADAAEVTRQVRATAGIEAAVDELIALYQNVLTEYREAGGDRESEGRAAAAYLDWLRDSLDREGAIYNPALVRLGRRLLRVPLLGRLIRTGVKSISSRFNP